MIASIFNTEEQRIVAALAKTDPSSNEYDDILVRYENLCRCALRGIDTEERIHYYLQDIANTTAEMTMPAPVTLTPVQQEQEETITFDEVKARFVEAARAGIKVADVLAKAGYAKLSEVPSSEYAKLLEFLPQE